MMDYADGGTLGHYLSKNFTSLSWTDKLNFAKQLASGVACLHKEKIFHRDLVRKFLNTLFCLLFFFPHNLTTTFSYRTLVMY
jgi:serine/threonine protein kinase